MDTDWAREVREMIARVPKGRVATYGQIAALCGRPGSARQVGRILREAGEDAKVPWHRILGAGGRIALGGGREGREQRLRLAAEGVLSGESKHVDLKTYGWRYSPGANSRKKISSIDKGKGRGGARGK